LASASLEFICERRDGVRFIRVETGKEIEVVGLRGLPV
jgi:hypothetical protein